MEWYNILLIIALFVTIALVIPWLHRFRAWQLFALIFGGFILGYLLCFAQQSHPDRPWHGYGFYVMLAAGLVYRAIKFFRTI